MFYRLPKYPILCFMFLILSGCGKNIQNDEITATVTKDDVPELIILQPFSDIPGEQVAFVHKELQKVYSNVKLKKAIGLPDNAYYKVRNRYRADSLIIFLRSKTPESCVTIGLTSMDISHTKGKIEDYGIMGLGFQPGDACVVSTYRLSKKNLLNQLFKLAVHELGHTRGLPHCSDKTCYMRDAEGKNHTDEEAGFCKRCREYLISKGWKLNINK